MVFDANMKPHAPCDIIVNRTARYLETSVEYSVRGKGGTDLSIINMKYHALHYIGLQNGQNSENLSLSW